VPISIDGPGRDERRTAHTVKVKTRSEPQAFKEGRKLHVYPSDYQGKREERVHQPVAGLLGAGLGDWSVVWERRPSRGIRS